MTTHEAYPQIVTPEQSPEEFFREVYGGVDQQIRSGLIERIGENLPEHVRQIEEYGITKINGLFDAEKVAQMQEDVASWRDKINRGFGFSWQERKSSKKLSAK